MSVEDIIVVLWYFELNFKKLTLLKKIGKEIVYIYLKLLKNKAMISYYDFKNLPNQAQCSFVMNEGRIMSERTVNSVKYVLYEVSYFTVEIICNTVNNKTEVINVFQNKGAYAV